MNPKEHVRFRRTNDLKNNPKYEFMSLQNQNNNDNNSPTLAQILIGIIMVLKNFVKNLEM